VDDRILASGQAAFGAGLISTPYWVSLLHEVSLLASAVTAICGAIIGVHAVVRLLKRKPS
jgi:hypothetical protein